MACSLMFSCLKKIQSIIHLRYAFLHKLTCEQEKAAFIVIKFINYAITTSLTFSCINST